MDFLNDLNSQQRKAVEYSSGPALVLAGAGSGKTRALTYRLAYLIKSGVEPSNVLAITFTNKAADEMKERTKHILLSEKTKRHNLPFLGTFHSMAAMFLRKELNSLDYGFNSDFVIFDRNDSQSLLKEIVKGREIDKDKFNPRKLINFISSCKQDQIDHQSLPDDEYNLKEIKPIYREYQKRLKENNALDFDDILFLFVRVLEDKEEIRNKYQTNFKHILVDEYQDTNQIQYKMIKLLAGQDNPNLMVVGDDWQSIYGFRGADYKNILSFKNSYPRAKIFKLEQNFRSSDNIVSAAQALIEHNSQRSKKKLWTENKSGDKIGLIETQTGEKEAKKVVELIKEKDDYCQTAVLYRTHAQSRLIEEALIHNQIPYQIIGGLRFYQRKEIKDLISYLFVAYQESKLHLKRIINTPRRGIGQKTIKAIEASNWQLDQVNSAQVRDFQQLNSELKQRAGELTVDRLLDWLVKKIDYQEYIENYSETKEQAQYRWENIEELIAVAGKYSKLEPRKSLAAFLEEVSLMDFQDEIDDRNKVTLMTLHNAKGLEYETVFMIGLEEGLLPHKQSLVEREQLEEERRLCYVGMTRAKSNLYLSWASSRYMYGQPEIQDRSQFLSEIPDKYFHQIQTSGIEKQKVVSQDSLSEFDADLSSGDWVEHLSLGRAKVISVDGSMVEVDFPGLGKKKLSLDYAPLKKIDRPTQ